MSRQHVPLSSNNNMMYHWCTVERAYWI